MGLRTRRLGTRLHSFFSTEMSSARFRFLLKPSSVLLYCPSPHTVSCRGNSKYHYYGIRVKPDSPLNRLQEDMQYMALRQQPVQQKQRYHGQLGTRADLQRSLWHKLAFFSTLRRAMWFQVQASAEVWCLLWGELLRWRPATSWCSRADGHCTEPTPPAVLRSLLSSRLSGWFWNQKHMWCFLIIARCWFDLDFPDRCIAGTPGLRRAGPGAEQYREHRPRGCESSAVPLQRALWG